jgi:acyl transferase domain-containing protein
MSAPRIPYVSNLTGTWIRPEQATDPLYWARHLRLPVRFSAGLKTIFEDPDVVLLEVGPGRSLGALAKLNGAGPRTVVSSMRHPREEITDVEALLAAQGRLWLAGLPIAWEGFHRHEQHGRRHRVSLPTYPFERQRYWIERQEPPRRGEAEPLVTIEWEPGMSPQELGEALARALASGELRVVVSRPGPAAAQEPSGPAAEESGTGAVPYHSRPVLGTPYVAPSNPLEEKLAALWQDLLGIGGIGVQDNFYELGGHSLLATLVISRVREQFAVAVPLQELFSEPTIARLADLVAQGQADRLNEGELAQLLAEVQELSESDLSGLLGSDLPAELREP